MSGTFVQIPSTPHLISSRMRSGSSQVHVLSSDPGLVTLVDGRPIQRTDPWMQGERWPRSTSKRRRRSDVDHEPRRRDAGTGREHGVDHLEVERRDQPSATIGHLQRLVHDPRARAIGCRRSPARPASFLISMLTVTLGAAPSAGAGQQASRRSGMWSGRSRRSRSMIAAPSLQSSIVMHDQTAVTGAAHVELDAVDAHRHGELERLDGVLDRSSRCAAMGDDVGHHPDTVHDGTVVSITAAMRHPSRQIRHSQYPTRQDPFSDGPRGFI